jgi:hypothetical protein
MRGQEARAALHEPQHAAGILPSESSGSTLVHSQ